jgi:hypothetical protein
MVFDTTAVPAAELYEMTYVFAGMLPPVTVMPTRSAPADTFMADITSDMLARFPVKVQLVALEGVLFIVTGGPSELIVVFTGMPRPLTLMPV